MNKYQYKVQGVDYDVEIEEVEGNLAKVSVNGIKFEVELKEPINAAQIKKTVTPPKSVAMAPATQTATQTPHHQTSIASNSNGTPIKAPLPGTVVSLNVKIGDKVNVGDTILVLEAMKMQNNIEAEYAGTVTSILVNQGDSVLEGAVLLTIA